MSKIKITQVKSVIDRSKRPLKPTPHGKIYYEGCLELVERYQNELVGFFYHHCWDQLVAEDLAAAPALYRRGVLHLLPLMDQRFMPGTQRMLTLGQFRGTRQLAFYRKPALGYNLIKCAFHLAQLRRHLLTALLSRVRQ